MLFSNKKQKLHVQVAFFYARTSSETTLKQGLFRYSNIEKNKCLLTKKILSFSLKSRPCLPDCPGLPRPGLPNTPVYIWEKTIGLTDQIEKGR